MSRFIKLKGGSYGPFSIDQPEPKPRKLGVGPYALFCDAREIKRRPRHSDCRDDLEQLVREQWQLEAQICELKAAFCKRWNLRGYPSAV